MPIGRERSRSALEAPVERDLRLDLLRGLCVARMILVHLGWNSNWIRFPFGLVTAAEGFFLISGVTLGTMARREIEGGRFAALAKKLVLRALWLWLANTALVLLFRKLVGTCANPEGVLALYWGATPRWLQIASFDQPAALQVLPRYVVFLLAAPLVLLAIRSGYTAAVVFASAALWSLHAWLPSGAYLPYLETAHATFPVAAWQLLFVVGIALGHRLHGRDRPPPTPAGRSVLVASAVVVVVFALFEQLWIAAVVERFPGLVSLLAGRPALGPLRLFNLAALAIVLLELADRYRDGIVRWAGWLLLPLGRKSLVAFLLHIPLAWLAPCAVAFAPAVFSAPLYAWSGLVLVALAARSRRIRAWLAPV